MRFGVCGVSVLALSLIVSGPALAQVMSAVPAIESAAAVEPPAPPAPPTLAQQAAGAAVDVARREKAHADDIAALQAYYTANPDKPLWIEEGLLGARARAALEEIAKADDWGLTAASFSLPSPTLAGADPAWLA